MRENNYYSVFTSLILSLSRSVQKIKNEEMANFGLKGNQVQCLYVLYHAEGPVNLSKLCELCCEDKGAMSRTVRELTKSNLVYTEEKGDQKYKNPIRLTPEGEDFAKFVTDRINSISRLGGIGISNAERKVLYSALDRINNNLERVCENYAEDKVK